MYVISISEYQDQWKDLFQVEKAKLLGINKTIVNIYHVGSTAIPNMPAKPIIDMIIEVDNFENIKEIEEKFLAFGYSKLRRSIIPAISAISQKQSGHASFNAHFFICNDPQIERHLNFRDFLSENSVWLKKYADLKIQLAKNFGADKELYNSGKDALIHELDCLAKLTLQNSNVPNDISLHNTVHLSKNKIFESALLNHYLLLTHYSQYVSQYDFCREPGITVVNSKLNSPEFNHIIDIDYSLEVLERKVAARIKTSKASGISFQWWDCFCNDPANLNTVLSEHGAKQIKTKVLYKIFNQEKYNLNDEYKFKQLLSPQDLSLYRMSALYQDECVQSYFDLVSKIPHSQTDAMQFYQFIHRNEVVGYFTIIYYSNVAGIYWMSSIVENDYFPQLTLCLNQDILKNYSIVTLFIKDDVTKYEQCDFLQCGEVISYIT